MVVDDPDLRFGHMAARVGLIDQGQLIDGFRAWTGDERLTMDLALPADPFAPAGFRPAR